jgi:hypothetical protein
MKNNIPAILALGLLTGPLTAHADLVRSATGAVATFRQCVSGETACDSVGPSLVRTFGGLPGDLTAQASQADPSYGSSEGSAQITAAPGVADLSASASSLPGTRNGGNSVMLQRYTNTGASAETLSFGITLTYDQSVPAENASFPLEGGAHSRAAAEIAIFTLEVDSYDVGTTAEEVVDALMSEPGPDIGFKELKFAVTGPISNESGSGTTEIAETVTVEPGDSIWLWAILQCLAANGAVVNAAVETKLGSMPVAPTNAHGDGHKEN